VRGLFRALAAVLLLVLIALVSAMVTMRLAIHGTEVRVPAVTGMPAAEAARALHGRSLEVTVDGHYYSPKIPAGSVLTQSPAAGTQVRKHWPVRIAVSLGAQKVPIPELEGMEQSLATMTLRRLGLQPGNTVALPYAYAPAGTVIAQTPLANAGSVQDPRVSLLTAAPLQAEPPASIVPDLTGIPFTEAAWAVIHAGFQIAPIQPAQSPAPAQTAAVPPGTVIAQSPPAGSRITAGQAIQLSVQP
jgi:beta-lactam-binding protein with PASTA domain